MTDTAEPTAEEQPQRKTLTRDDILNADDRRPEPLLVPEWGGQIFIRRLSGWQASTMLNDKLGKPGAAADIIIACVSPNKDGVLPMFTQDDREALLRKSLRVVNRVANHALYVNGLTPAAMTEDMEAAKKA
jgi:hypothetical protein